MIVHPLDHGQLLCVNQTSHALMAAAFCRHWGNGEFMPPAPYDLVMLAITQHDNGWAEWEAAPDIRDDGYPMDFLHGPNAAAKLALWERGIDRVAAQHPYAGILVGQHAALLYRDSLEQITDSDEHTRTVAFIDAQEARLARLRTEAAHTHFADALQEPAVQAHTRLLQFGDSASLQVCMPWGPRRVFTHAPVDDQGTVAAVTMEHQGSEITFAPWPFGVDSFTVRVHGRLLARRHFSHADDYRQALTQAPFHQRCWHVRPGA